MPSIRHDLSEGVGQVLSYSSYRVIYTLARDLFCERREVVLIRSNISAQAIARAYI